MADLVCRVRLLLALFITHYLIASPFLAVASYESSRRRTWGQNEGYRRQERRAFPETAYKTEIVTVKPDDQAYAIKHSQVNDTSLDEHLTDHGGTADTPQDEIKKFSSQWKASEWEESVKSAMFRRLLHMPALSEEALTPYASRRGVATPPPRPAPEYMHALFYTVVETEARPWRMPVDGRPGDEHAVWAIKAFSVHPRSTDLIEATFHISLTFEPDIIPKVELVFESERRTERTARHRQTRFTLQVCDAQPGLHTEWHREKLADDAEEDVREGGRQRVRETKIDEAVEILKGNVLPSNYALNRSRGAGDILKDKREFPRKTDARAPQSSAPTHCQSSLNVRRRRLVGHNHEYNVYDVTRQFLAWWPDCGRNRVRGVARMCTATLKLLSAGGMMASDGFNEVKGDAMLIIYKNVAADLPRTRRALRSLTVNERTTGSAGGWRSSAGDLDDSDGDGGGDGDLVTAGGTAYGTESKRKRQIAKAAGRGMKPKVSAPMLKTPEKLGGISQSVEASPMCRLHRWRLDFAMMGWTWIIAPSSFEANFCAGSCDVEPNEIDAYNMSNNAFLRNVYRTETGEMAVPAPSCVPLHMSPMNILYRRDDETIVLRRVNDIQVDRCGCI